MRDTIVLYPSPGMGHLVSMVELGKAILKHSTSSLSVSIIITTVPFATGSTDSYLTGVTTTTPAITFCHLPTIPPPPIPLTPPNVPLLNFEYSRLQNPNLRDILVSMSLQSGNTIKAFVYDFFCFASTDVTKELSIPTYYFSSASANLLALFLYMPTLRNKMESLKKVDKKAVYHDIPSLPPINLSDLPPPTYVRTHPAYAFNQQTAISIKDCSGIIINTFEFFEEKVIKAIKDGKCSPDGSTPPIYSIGPLMSTNKVDGHECLSWLDSQPSQSVVFLCFGSLGVFSEEQLIEIANGLEKSGVRFLWVVRVPLSKSELDLNSVLPDGFIERTKDRGFVVKNWAPQLAVLSHGSVGGFVTHCGWSSVCEAMYFCVPMIAWPLYAEQKMNRVYLVEELKIGLRLDMSETGFVTAAELQERVKELMESEKVNMLRDQVAMFRDGAVAAMADGGSSKVEMLKFIAKVRSVS